jgi:hypothetical protein
MTDEEVTKDYIKKMLAFAVKREDYCTAMNLSELLKILFEYEILLEVEKNE